MDIVEELRKDRENGAKRLVSEYKAGLMSLARRFYKNESDAEELVNATFAKVVANIDDYLEQSAFFAWMCQILTNEFRDSVKRKSNKVEIYPGVLPDVADDDAQEEIFRNLDHSLLRDAIEPKKSS
jgi:RNA polymerase sigma factor (sigma-70 family)